MTDPHEQFIDDLGAELRRVAAVPARTRAASARRWAAGVGILATLTVVGTPVTRAAVSDLTGAFAAWVEGDDSVAPGRAVEVGDDAPDWVRDARSRVIAETAGVQLFVRSDAGQLEFVLGNGVAISDSPEGWRERFASRDLVVLGPALSEGRPQDSEGRFVMLGVTSRSVERIRLIYASGPSMTAPSTGGGFAVVADGARDPREIEALQADGTVVDRAEVRSIRPPRG